MKLLIVILDGIADETFDEFGGKTPFDFAKTPNLDKIKSMGNYGYFDTKKDGFPAESSSCILNIIGAEEKAFTLGRSFYEAKAKDISIKKDESVVRINIVTTDKNGILTSFNGQGLLKNEIEEIFAKIKEKYNKTYALSGYKGLMIFKTDDLKSSPLNIAPHENIGLNYNNLINKNIGKNEFLQDILNNINIFLKKYNKQNIFYKAYFYSKEKETNIKSFENIYSKNAGFVGFTEIAVGIAKSMKMHTVIPENTTGDIDTNLKNKVTEANKMLQKHNVCFVHINGCDEISHRKNPIDKVNFIEKIDNEFFGEFLKGNDNLKILAFSDHITSSKTGMHQNGLVPYVTNISDINNLKIKAVHEIIKEFV